jgi:arylsulfatase A-like enzyme
LRRLSVEIALQSGLDPREMFGRDRIEQARGRVGRAAILLALAWLATGAPAAADSSTPVRLIEKLRTRGERTLGGVHRRVLPPARAGVAIPLDQVPDDPILYFSVGFDEGPADEIVRFEVFLEPANQQALLLYQRDVRQVGWRDESIDLAKYELAGAHLLFRRTALQGGAARLWRSFFGEPILLPRRPARRPSVLLVSIDTLRSDFVGVYGAPTSTPTIDGLARSGVWFEQAYGSSNWTIPSHHGLLRAVYPSALPGYGRLDASQAVSRAWHHLSTSLAEALRDAGYLTAGFTGGGFMNTPFGFGEGFDVYFAYEARHKKAVGCRADRFDGPEVFRQAREWLATYGNRPFFLFVHTYDAHDRCPFFPPGVLSWPTLTGDRRNGLLAYYRSQIEGADHLLGGLIDKLRELSLDATTLVIVTSDHGEAFWEHDGISAHGCDVKPYEEVVRVPLILRQPGVLTGGRRITTPVSGVAVAPTVLDLLGVPRPETMKRAPALPLDPASGDAGDAVVVHCDDLLAVREGPYKLITSRKGEFPPELYDLASDPGEKHPLPPEHPAAARLRQRADRYWTEAAAAAAQPAAGKRASKTPREQRPGATLNDATRERLRALGYTK